MIDWSTYIGLGLTVLTVLGSLLALGARLYERVDGLMRWVTTLEGRVSDLETNRRSQEDDGK